MVYSHTLIGKKYLLTQSGNRWWQRSYTLVPINMFYLPLLKISFVGPRNLKEFFCSFSPPMLYRLFLRIFKAWKFYFIFHFYQCNLMKVLASICQRKNSELKYFALCRQYMFFPPSLLSIQTPLLWLLWPWKVTRRMRRLASMQLRQ